MHPSSNILQDTMPPAYFDKKIIPLTRGGLNNEQVREAWITAMEHPDWASTAPLLASDKSTFDREQWACDILAQYSTKIARLRRDLKGINKSWLSSLHAFAIKYCNKPFYGLKATEYSLSPFDFGKLNTVTSLDKATLISLTALVVLALIAIGYTIGSALVQVRRRWRQWRRHCRQMDEETGLGGVAYHRFHGFPFENNDCRRTNSYSQTSSQTLRNPISSKPVAFRKGC